MTTNQELVPLQRGLNDDSNITDATSMDPRDDPLARMGNGTRRAVSSFSAAATTNSTHAKKGNNRARVANDASDANTNFVNGDEAASPTSFLHFEDEEDEEEDRRDDDNRLENGQRANGHSLLYSARNSNRGGPLESRLLQLQEYLPAHPPHCLDGLSHGIFHPSPNVNRCIKTSLLCLFVAFFVWTFATFLLTSSLKVCWSSADEWRILDKSRPVQGPIPLPRAHSHNDYMQSVPLWQALYAGFCAVEADVHLVNDRLMLGHDRPTQSSLLDVYLDPMANLTRKNGGYIFERASRLNVCKQVTLLIDFKALDKVAAWSELERLLSSPRYLLSDGTRIFEAYATVTGEIIPNPSDPTRLSPIRVVVSGVDENEVVDLTNRMLRMNHSIKLDVPNPVVLNTSPEVRKTAGWVSQKWLYEWPPAEADGKTRTAALVKAGVESVSLALASSAFSPTLEYGRRYVPSTRYWNTPEDPELWEMLLEAGVDIINTDHILLLHSFLLGKSLWGLE